MGGTCCTNNDPTTAEDGIVTGDMTVRKDELGIAIKDGFYYPKDESQVQAIVKKANKEGKKVRVLGSGHSARGSILGGNDSYRVRLDKMHDVVSWDEDNMRVTVEAGMILYHNSKRDYSTKTNGLCHQIDQKGWAGMLISILMFPCFFCIVLAFCFTHSVYCKLFNLLF